MILFPGSFDPFTIGHARIVERALALFDQVVIVVAINSSKNSTQELSDRVENIEKFYPDNNRVSVVMHDGLVVDLATQMGAKALLKGVRSVADFESERTLADINRSLTGIETVILFSEPEYAHISSSLVRELIRFGRDVSNLTTPKK